MRDIASYGVGFFNQRLFTYEDRNVHLALSGGRSSAAMLRLLLDQYGGALPSNFKVVFTNTGREHPKTLEFLARIADAWKVDIVWLELIGIDPGEKSVTYKVVSYETADRIGTPFHILREAKPRFPPRRANRLCTLYMKVYVADAYRRALGWDAGIYLLGYRADESKRLHRAALRCGKDKSLWVPDAPLLRAGIDKTAVRAFFKQNDFDLGIPDLCGNCTFCFLKGEEKLAKITQIMPGEIDWWIDLETAWGVSTQTLAHPMQYTILPHGGYSGIKERALASLPPPEPDDDIEDLECNCTD